MLLQEYQINPQPSGNKPFPAFIKKSGKEYLALNV